MGSGPSSFIDCRECGHEHMAMDGCGEKTKPAKATKPAPLCNYKGCTYEKGHIDKAHSWATSFQEVSRVTDRWANKILEEAQEVIEAVRYQDPINQLTEIRDVIGACALFVGEHFPKTDFLTICRGAIAMNKARSK